MKRLITLLLSIFFLFAFSIPVNAQSHSFKMGCRFFKPPPVTQGKAVTSESVCPVCYKQKEDERKARLAEDTRRATVAAAEEKARAEKIKADKAAAEAKEKIEAEKRKQRIEAEQQFEEFSKNQQRYIENLKIDINKKYTEYDAVKASQKIPPRIKSLKLVRNEFAKTYELYAGEELVKSFDYSNYWVYQLSKEMPYFIVSEHQRKINKLSILDAKGEPIAIGGEKYFQSVKFNNKNNTLEFEVAKEEPELLYDGSTADQISGIYTTKSDVQKVINLIKLEYERRRNLPDKGNNEVKIVGFGIKFYGNSSKRFVTGFDLTILESKSVYVVP